MSTRIVRPLRWLQLSQPISGCAPCPRGYRAARSDPICVAERNGRASSEMGTSKQWEIEGYESTRLIFSKNVPLGFLSEREMIALLQRLVSRHLEPNEVVAASLRSNATA